MYTPKYLVCVTNNNNNKYYKMIPKESSWIAEYGRVGSTKQSVEYSYNVWQKKYKKKKKKGYIDQSHLIEELVSKNLSSHYKEIENKDIAEIVNRLQSMANKALSENYTVSSDKVTQAMIDEAQIIINDLMIQPDISSFNAKLIELFRVIPRKMNHVSEHLVDTKNDFDIVIKREQDLLDVMQHKINQNKLNTNFNVANSNNTILESLGIEFGECDDEDIKIIKDSLGECYNKFYKAWKVNNKNTREKFDKYCSDNKIYATKLLFHGSRNENWWSIINTGLVLKPTNAVITGKMFGHGIYYATKAKKSLGYTSLNGSYWVKGNSSSGFMALMEVAVGKAYNVYNFDSKFYNFDSSHLEKACPGAHSLWAHAGKGMLVNDEIVIYNESQCTIKYLIELR